MTRPMMPPDTAPAVSELAARIRDQFPRLRLVAKERSLLMRAVARLMPWNRAFLSAYTMTIGYRVFMPAAVRRDPREGVAILRHERVHLEQFRRHPVWFPVSYLLVLPAGITMRARWELEAYVETMRAELDETGTIADASLDRMARQFTGPDYLFMDVRKRVVRRKLVHARERVLSER